MKENSWRRHTLAVMLAAGRRLGEPAVKRPGREADQWRGLGNGEVPQARLATSGYRRQTTWRRRGEAGMLTLGRAMAPGPTRAISSLNRAAAAAPPRSRGGSACSRPP